MRRLTVFWWKNSEKIRVGELAQPKRSSILFEWDKNFLANDIELSPIKFQKSAGIIDLVGSKFDGINGLFADHIPDGWGRILLKRGLEKQGIVTTELSPLDMLMYIGEKGMGALSFEPAMKRGSDWANGEIDLDKLESGIEPILSGTASEVLQEFIEGGASPNGMRPKILLKEKKGKFHLGGGVGEDEWLVKFRSPIDSVEIGKLEYIYSLMAKDAGLDMPETKLFETKKGSFFGSKRFDRGPNGRIHMHTLSGLIESHPSNMTISYDHLVSVAQSLTNDIREVERVFKLAAFNVLASNQDDHSRNVSFLMNAEGKWSFAPAYDLVFSRSQNNEQKMTIKENGNPNQSDLLEFGVDIGISKTKVKAYVEQIVDAISQFDKHARKYSVISAEARKINSYLGELCLKSGKKRGR